MMSLFARSKPAASPGEVEKQEASLDAALAAAHAAEHEPAKTPDLSDLDAAFDALTRGAFDEAVAKAGSFAGPVERFAQAMRVKNRADLEAAVAQTGGIIGQTIGTASLFRNANDTTRHTESIAAAVEELAATAASIADNCKAAAEDATASMSAAKDEASLVEAMKTTTEAMGKSVTAAVSRLDQLSEATARIGSVIEQIESIARQTNLLALNATIEAARAGEAGRGFAVVAGEVRALAGKTSTATQDIRERVGELGTGSQAIVAAMGEVNARVAEGDELMDKLASGIGFLSERASATGSMVDSMSETVATQSAAAEDISQSIQTIAAAVAGNLDALEALLSRVDQQQADAAATLNKLGEMDIPGKSIILAKTDHLLWVKRIAAMLIGREKIDTAKLRDHHGCRFGKWYDANAGKPISRTNAYINIDEPHRNVHACGVAAAEAYERGNMTGALEAFERMTEQSRTVLAFLDELIAHEAA